ncbi:uncharacterized protein [Diadema setosum]|uniref:uncharacterized protein isoform X2 n=1 Tax=Diadema setosum TaxID=31175 RepID=UPI003B3B3CA5
MSSISGIRDRMNAMKTDLSDTNAEIRRLETEIQTYIERAEDAENEAKKLNSKLMVGEDRKCEMEEEHKQLKARIDEVERESDEHARTVKVLTARETSVGDKLRDQEQILTDQRNKIEQLDQLNNELQARVADTEEKLERAEDMGIHLKSILEDNQEELNQLRNNYKSYHASHCKMQDDEEKYQHKIDTMQCELDECLNRAGCSREGP